MGQNRIVWTWVGMKVDPNPCISRLNLASTVWSFVSLASRETRQSRRRRVARLQW